MTHRSYVRGQQLGNETRTLEFKRAGGDIKALLRENLAKYMCAFLNGEGGALMLGVDDSGRLLLECPHQKQKNSMDL